METTSVLERIYTIVKRAEGKDKASRFYNLFITLMAIASLVPLMFREQTPLLEKLDTITVYFLFLDYILRWMTYGFEHPERKSKWWAYLLYPLTPFAIFDLLSLLPSLGVLNQGFSILRMLRFVKILRYSKNFMYISNVIKNERKTLLSVLIIAIAYIFISALAMFCNEDNETFSSFFDALYWATTALTTVGYGDIYPHTDLGRLISMISSLFGIAIIALPAGIVTGGYIDQMNKAKTEAQEADKAPVSVRRLSRSQLYRFSAVVIIGIVLNEVCYQLVKELPLWLDMVGTCFAAMVMGPAAGLLVGLADNYYLALSGLGNLSIIYYAVSACAALMVGFWIGKAQRITWKRILWVGAATIVSSSLISFAITMLMSGGVPGVAWEYKIYSSIVAAGFPGWVGCLCSASAIKAMDGVVTVVLLCGLQWLVKLWRKNHGESKTLEE
ncbi:MAG: ion transporter [Eubacteriales bacterium]|nr:ion transporter [Eubacteriales bacterium]